MIPITQTKLHSNTVTGNCLAASLASILEIPLSDVPEFENMKHPKWWDAMRDWLFKIGFDFVQWREPVVLPGYYLVMGTSPRDPAINHQVIYLKGEMVHDPHPSRDGVVNIKEVIALIPLDPAKVVIRKIR